MELSDGRFVIGDLLCTDKDMNIVLGNCEENIPRTREDHESQNVDYLKRILTMAVVPGKHIKSIAVSTTT